MQQICIDEQSLSQLRARGGLYVDKTEYLYNILKNGKYFFIARPRRFGKSLLCSTIAELFSANRPLFKNTWIDSSDWQWQDHPVLRLDMTQAAGAASDAAIVRRGMVNVINDNARLLGIADLIEEAPHLMLTQLIKKLHEKTGKGVVVVIDEYDKPLLDVIDDPVRYKAIHKELAALYGQLKACSEQLRLVFLTGVFKFAQTSIFSGLNNINDLTFSPKAAEMLGYTAAEITTYFAEHLEALAHGYKLSVTVMFEKLREQYNGYTFGVDDKADCVVGSVYNPFALNYVFSDQQLIEKWFVSGTPTALIKKLEEGQFVALDPENLVVDFNKLKASCDADEMTALSMLYYAGYVTMRDYNQQQKSVTLDFPNAEVAQATSSHLLPLITQKEHTNFGPITRKLNTLLYNQQLSDLQELLNNTLANLPYFLFGIQEGSNHPREHYYQTVFFMLLNASNVVTIAEDMTNCGRMDITVLLTKVIYIFELKMDQSAAVAIQQIKDKNYAAKYRASGRQIFAIGIRLSSKERVAEELLFEQL